VATVDRQGIEVAAIQQINVAAPLAGGGTGSTVSLSLTVGGGLAVSSNALILGPVSAVSHQWISSISAAGMAVLTQPAVGDLQSIGSNTLVANPTGVGAAPATVTLGATLAFVGGGLQTTAFTGDVTASANSFVTTIAAAAVTYAKIQNVAASRVLGNPTGSPASASEISLGATLAFSGTALQTAALTGDVTASANSFVTTIAANAVTNAKAAQMAANTIKANNTGSPANASDVTVPQLAAMLSLPQVSVLTSSGTYTTPANARYLTVEMIGGGGGGGGSGSGGGISNGGAGGNTTFGSSFLTCNGGGGGDDSLVGGAVGGAGGTATGGDINPTGASGVTGFALQSASVLGPGGNGAASYFGGGGLGGTAAATAGTAGPSYGSGGGGGAGATSSFGGGGGGGAGGYLRKLVTSPAGTYAYSVGAAGTAGSAGTSGFVGGAGTVGTIIVTAYFQ
jgi:hypothetical protein